MKANGHTAAVERACRIIESSQAAPKLAALAKSVGMSSFHFHRVFTKAVGLTPKAYADARRAERMRAALSRRGSVTEAMYASGYNSSSRFYEKSVAMLGMRPARFRKGGAGATIRFAVGECSLGSVLVAASDQGVCAILLGDDPEDLVRDLQRRFRKANLIGGDNDFERTVSRVVGFLEQPGTNCDLPLDIRGTAFQQKVWQALRKIPPGTTTTYADIARHVGMPSAVRAVAGAIAANPIAVAIPCHRVIRTDGSLSGYRWGIARKRGLISRERSLSRT
jgi:AraC family transcriptional regulator of adaptative response/methylated-DNA-[protein]-cysteine methyltransferase